MQLGEYILDDILQMLGFEEILSLYLCSKNAVLQRLCLIHLRKHTDWPLDLVMTNTLFRGLNFSQRRHRFGQIVKLASRLKVNKLLLRITHSFVDYDRWPIGWPSLVDPGLRCILKEYVPSDLQILHFRRSRARGVSYLKAKHSFSDRIFFEIGEYVLPPVHISNQMFLDLFVVVLDNEPVFGNYFHQNISYSFQPKIYKAELSKGISYVLVNLERKEIVNTRTFDKQVTRCFVESTLCARATLDNALATTFWQHWINSYCEMHWFHLDRMYCAFLLFVFFETYLANYFYTLFK